MHCKLRWKLIRDSQVNLPTQALTHLHQTCPGPVRTAEWVRCTLPPTSPFRTPLYPKASRGMHSPPALFSATRSGVCFLVHQLSRSHVQLRDTYWLCGGGSEGVVPRQSCKGLVKPTEERLGGEGKRYRPNIRISTKSVR